jgi:hypothetical protein
VVTTVSEKPAAFILKPEEEGGSMLLETSGTVTAYEIMKSNNPEGHILKSTIIF